MALAPRNPAPESGTPKHTSSTQTKTGKAAQRARNKANGSTTRSGSAGTATTVAKAPKRLWDEVKDEVTHLADIAGKISHSQVGASGYLVSTVSSPLEYAHDLLDVHIKARDGLIYMRLYYVSMEDYMGADADEDDPFTLEDYDGS